jgi:penicillin-binding protein 1C
MATGGDDVIELMKKLGFTQLQSADFYGPSLALGTVDISLWELTHAYQQLAKSTPMGLSRHTKQTLFDILSSPENRVLTFQTDSVLTLPFDAAVKTGTSKDMRDNWCVGWTKEYTVGVWVGNFNGDAMWQVSGITGAAPIWRRVMLALHRDNPINPSTVSKQAVALTSQKNRDEQLISDAKNTQISYPVQESFIAQDPEIPEASQKILITIANPQMGHTVWMDQSFLSRSKQYIPWALIKGRHEITLKDQHNKIIHEVNFEVR